MKTKIMIIEDNFYKSFTTKQILESQLKLDVRQIDVQTNRELALVAAELNPDVIMCRPLGGVADLLLHMKKRHSNRRNTEITLVLAQDLDDDSMRKCQLLIATPDQDEAVAA